MSIKNHKKAFICLAIVAVMSLGGATAFAATAEPTLTPTDAHIDTANVQMGTYKVVQGVTPKLPDGLKFTAPGDSFTPDGTVKTLDANVTLVNGKIVGDFTDSTAARK